MIAPILILVFVALLALPVAGGDPSAVEAKKKSRTITRTFSNNGQIALPDFGAAVPYPVTLSVAGFRKGKIKDVNLVLREFSHTFPDAVGVLLVSPNGRDALVMSDVGGTADVAGLRLRLDDEAKSGLPVSTQLSSGAFQPTSANDNAGSDEFAAPAPLSSGNVALADFDGGNPNGEWRLFVRDGSAGAGGFAGGFSLEITAKVKRPKKQ